MEEKLVSKLEELMQNNSDIEFEVNKMLNNIRQLDNIEDIKKILSYKLTLLNYICILNKIFKKQGIEEIPFKITSSDRLDISLEF